MAAMSPSTFSSRSDPNLHKFTFQNPSGPSWLRRSSLSTLHSQSLPSSHSFSRVPDSALCRCRKSSNDSDSPFPSAGSSVNWWDSAFQEALRNAIKRFDDYTSSFLNQPKDVAMRIDVVDGGIEAVNDEDEDWDWDRWWKHFGEVDEQEQIVSILKLQLAHAVNSEDYKGASRLKVAIAAAATIDTVGRVMSQLNRAIMEERYIDAACIRDYAGAGLVGWWAGISEDTDDPYGCIIRISAEYGRYVARSYSPHQLATATAGTPLFEIFLAVNKRGEFKQKAVYLRRMGAPQHFPAVSSESLGPTRILNPLDTTEDKPDVFASTEDSGDDEHKDDDSDIVEGLPGFDNILRDMIPFKVFQVTAPGKVDRELISKLIDMIDEENEEKDAEVESADHEDGGNGESDEEQNEIEIDAGGGILDGQEQSETAVRVVVVRLPQNVSSNALNKKLIRIPASLEKRGRLSFSFSTEKDDKKQVSIGKGRPPLNKKDVISDLVKSMGRGKTPMKVLKDFGELIKRAHSEAHSCQFLSGSTTFSRLEILTSPDPLNGLYVRAYGISPEVVHLTRKFGHWQEDGGTSAPPTLEFYEYVEAVKLIGTGDFDVPAGQVAFRAKVGERYQSPHKGTVLEEFGPVAIYKGQGRLADPGFQNPRWVDGELHIYDGKHFKGVGFVYLAPERQLALFNQPRLQE